MTPKDRQEMRERCDAATEGPWDCTVDGDVNALRDRNTCDVRLGAMRTIADARFAASARTDLPACLDDLEVAYGITASMMELYDAQQRIADLEQQAMSSGFDKAELDKRIAELEAEVQQIRTTWEPPEDDHEH